MFFLYKIPKQNLRFFEFLFFCFVRDGKSTSKSGSLGEAPCRVPYMTFWTHFFTLQKKTLLSKGTLEICTGAGLKTLPKKVPKNSFGGPSWAKNAETGPKNEKVCNLQKLILLERARIESGSKRRTLSGRHPRGNQSCVLWKKRVFLKKNVFFPTMLGFCTPAANFGASLRRPNWPCPEYPLLCYKTFFKKCAAAWGDAISA